MSPEKPPKNIEQKSIKSSEILSPSQKNFEQLSFEKLHEAWRENHKKLKQELHEAPPPYFGLHGTSEEAFQNIIKSSKVGLNIATFYEKEYESEQFIYKIYASALYVSSYAIISKSPGRIVVFNLEKDGKNITHPWEKLKPGNSMHYLFDEDSEEEEQHLSALDKPGGLLWRSDLFLGGKDFSERFAGSIDLNSDELRKYLSKLNDPWRDIMRNRFLAQEIITRALHLLAEKTK
ncbi:MAG: hypothetical protein NTX00_01225 [Candidatus Parcubacteria bacterium]|nr:hypothetical protein [Candidatus Parcubacteria bacterium]